MRSIILRSLIIAFVLISESASAQISRSIPIQQLEATLVTINSAATDVVSFSVGFPKYIVRRVIIYDASTSLVASAATLGIFTGAGGTGTTVVALTTMTALTATTKRLDTSLTLTSDYLTSNILFVRCGTAHGSAATVTVVIEIQVIP